MADIINVNIGERPKGGKTEHAIKLNELTSFIDKNNSSNDYYYEEVDKEDFDDANELKEEIYIDIPKDCQIKFSSYLDEISAGGGGTYSATYYLKYKGIYLKATECISY